MHAQVASAKHARTYMIAHCDSVAFNFKCHVVWTMICKLPYQNGSCLLCLQVLECSWEHVQPLSSTTAMANAAVTVVSSSWSGSYSLLGSADGVVRLEGRTASGKRDGRWVRSVQVLADEASAALTVLTTVLTGFHMIGFLQSWFLWAGMSPMQTCEADAACIVRP
jgi:hypothetical protein